MAEKARYFIQILDSVIELLISQLALLKEIKENMEQELETISRKKQETSKEKTEGDDEIILKLTLVPTKKKLNHKQRRVEYYKNVQKPQREKAAQKKSDTQQFDTKTKIYTQKTENPQIKNQNRNQENAESYYISTLENHQQQRGRIREGHWQAEGNSYEASNSSEEILGWKKWKDMKTVMKELMSNSLDTIAEFPTNENFNRFRHLHGALKYWLDENELHQEDEFKLSDPWSKNIPQLKEYEETLSVVQLGEEQNLPQ